MTIFGRELVAAVHAAPAQWVLAMTGGGASAAGELLAVPGGSRTILEVIVPYHEQALAEFLGYRPDQYCSEATSQAMARRALDRAQWLAPATPSPPLTKGGPGGVFGLGCTASLISDRPKRGDHRIHVSIAGRDQVRTWSLTLAKGQRDRQAEESVAAALCLDAMAQTLGLTPLPLPLLAGEQVADHVQVAEPWPACFAAAEAVYVGVDGQVVPQGRWKAEQPMVLVPGAFNPLHAGHWGLAHWGERLAGKPAAFELSVANVDKPELPLAEARRRLSQFAGHAPVWLTRAPRFLDKARLFPGAVFAVGADTAERIVAARYYDGDETRMLDALAVFRRQGCRFLVASRVDGSGRVLGVDEIAIPDGYRDLFAVIPTDVFRLDISSTILRGRTSS